MCLGGGWWGFRLCKFWVWHRSKGRLLVSGLLTDFRNRRSHCSELSMQWRKAGWINFSGGPRRPSAWTLRGPCDLISCSISPEAGWGYDVFWGYNLGWPVHYTPGKSVAQLEHAFCFQKEKKKLAQTSSWENLSSSYWGAWYPILTDVPQKDGCFLVCCFLLFDCFFSTAQEIEDF